MIFLSSLALIIASPVLADTPEPRTCSTSDFQACKSCNILARVTAKSDPNDGEYLHGAQWNALYAAYIHDCRTVAKTLFSRGANPNSGGSAGSMIISVADKWPHNNKAVNQKWAALLLKHGASGHKIVPEQGKTSKELLKEYGATPDYPDIWNQFQR